MSPKKAVQPPPAPFVVSRVEIVGRAETDAATVDMVVEVDVLEPSTFTRCPLLPTSVALLSSQVERRPESSDQASFLSLLDETNSAASEPAPLLVTQGQDLVLVACKGRYSVRLSALVPYASSLGQALNLRLPVATRTQLRFTIPAADVTVSVTPALDIVHSRDQVQGHTTVACFLAPTPDCTVKWTRTAEQKAAPSSSSSGDAEGAKKEMVVTSGQDILHSIGGGIVATTATCTYTISNAAVSVFEISIDGTHGSIESRSNNKLTDSPRCRILSVEGNGIKKWEVIDNPEQPRSQLLRVTMDSAIEGVSSLVLQSELEMVDTSCSVYLPTFSPLHVNRVKGSIAIQGRTAVEINELAARYLSRVDVKDLPVAMRNLPNILSAYKFITAGYILTQQVTKHSDVAVLVAVVEEAIYDVTHTGTHVLYSLFWRIRNTQSQFARLELPTSECVLWSALVSGEPVKPAQNKEGQLLLPLLKSQEGSFSIEVVFVLGGQQMETQEGHQSELSIVFPAIDMPINHLYATVYMPTDFNIDEWRGGLKEVDGFACGSPSKNLSSTAPQIQLYSANVNAYSTKVWKEKESKPMRSLNSRAPQQQQQRAGGHWNRRRDRDRDQRAWMPTAEADDDDLSMLSDSDSDGEGGGGGDGVIAGIKPLKFTSSMEVGQPFRFEKLLVNSRECVTLTTRYQKKPHRRLRPVVKEGKRCCTVM